VAADVHVVVTCTDRKRLPVPTELQLRSVATSDDRFGAWRRRLEQAERLTPALDLYSGEAWHVVRGLAPVTALGNTVNRWVISAGYGLVGVDTRLSPYGAAFSASKPDSVSQSETTTTSNANWWARLTDWDLQGDDSPRSITALTDANPEAIIVVACSEVYLRAIREDLERAAKHTSQLFVISPSGTCDAGHRIPCDARLQTKLGGSRMSMNNRALKHLLDSSATHSFDPQLIDKEFRSVLDKGTIVSYSRAPMTDDEVRRFIRRLLKDPNEARPAKSSALRYLRDTGKACEQKRFGRLWADETSHSVAGHS
jgi:hypothetical protein